MWLITHPRTLVSLVRVFAAPPMRPLYRVEPRLMFKFLPEYLTADLSRRERAAMLMHHYTFLTTRLDRDFFARIIDQRIEIWRLDAKGHAYRILLFLPRTPYREGDLALIFEADGDEIYTLAFTIGPGSIAGLAAPDAMYIPRVQGKGKRLLEIREATRNCGDVSPAALLLAAAEGTAKELGLADMIGISAKTQVMTSDGRQPENFLRAYDEFWKAAGGSRLDRNLFQLPVPSVNKSILAIKRGHRSRTLRKRRFKKAVAEQVALSFRAVAFPEAEPPAAIPDSARISATA
jgi:uncharacterized protein